MSALGGLSVARPQRRRRRELPVARSPTLGKKAGRGFPRNAQRRSGTRAMPAEGCAGEGGGRLAHGASRFT